MEETVLTDGSAQSKKRERVASNEEEYAQRPHSNAFAHEHGLSRNDVMA